ncbi:sulfotransferase family protein [Lyngbya aestuarii BL J]|uniref:Sulfotransferase family protein n=1 Tax=Lyngbya aestuarii BL J TaxID=1348334 RepID=U7QFQ9_9CYAN|nr:sulfotransferase family 2 domain-containing protein [Lyngbya aestuarii]ERT06112.1 sulfotransferase family protein [Lyngbya aestuarii BL J]
MISYKHKCIFVHIPKTGGTSLENIIWPRAKDRTESNLWMGFISGFHNKYQTGGLQHLLSTQIRQEVGDQVFNSFFKFTVVRNPWDKAISQFLYMKKRKSLRDFMGMSEDDCFKQYLSLIQKKNHVQWEPQYKFVFDDQGCLLVDFIGKFENFEQDAYKILDQSGVKTKILGIRVKKIPHTNKSNRLHYTEYYDTESREIVQNLYQKDIEIFNYTF